MIKISIVPSFVLIGISVAEEFETDPASPFVDRRVPKVVPSDLPGYHSKTTFSRIKRGNSIDPKTGEKIYDMEPIVIRPMRYEEEITHKKLKKQITAKWATTDSIMEFIKKESLVSEVLNMIILADFFPDGVSLFGFSSEEIAEMYKNDAKLERALNDFDRFYPDSKNRSKALNQQKFELMQMKREAIDWGR